MNQDNEQSEKRNPAPPAHQQIPRSQEEAEKIFAQVTKKEREEIIRKTEERNEKIRQAIAVKTVLEAEGFQVILRELKKTREELENNSIRTFRGNILDKGAQVESIQGGLAILDSIFFLFEDYQKLASEPVLDTSELRKIIDL